MGKTGSFDDKASADWGASGRLFRLLTIARYRPIAAVIESDVTG